MNIRVIEKCVLVSKELDVKHMVQNNMGFMSGEKKMNPAFGQPLGLYITI